MRHVWLALLLCLSTHAAAQAPAIVPILAADSEARWVAFDLTPGNQIRFAMTLNGKPASAVLDTGVSFTVASSGFAKSLGLKTAAQGSAAAIGGTVAVGWAAIGDVAIGGLSRRGGRIAVTDLKAIATGSTTPVDVLVGADLLGHAALDIDYDARRFPPAAQRADAVSRHQRSPVAGARFGGVPVGGDDRDAPVAPADRRYR